uniref:chitinase n=1 Tax=Chelonus sp. TaxID=7406 RepID=Q23737_9HYME|nr:venom chitinase [Chelonus sp.]
MRLIILFVAISLVSTIAVASPNKVVCYFGAWSVYRQGNGKFDINGIDPTLCTHLIYSFVGVNGKDVKVLDPWSDLPGNLDGFGKFTSLRKKNPSVKIMVAVGGWNAGSVPFSQMASDQATREAFAQNVVKFLQQYQFDGFDIDWEYPAQRGGSPADVKNMVKLCKALKKAFVQHDYILSAAVAAPETSASKSYDIAEMSQYLDFINLMTYDFHGPWDGHTGMHAPPSASSHDSGNELKLNVKAAVKYWLQNGVPKEKLVVGVPAYGKSFTLSNPSNKGLGAPVSGAGTAGPYTGENGLLGYNEICEMQKAGDWEVVQDNEKGVPYAVKGNQWVSFDDLAAIKAKAQFIKQEGLGGAMVWSIETDDFKGLCGEKYPVLKALNSVLGRGGSSSPAETKRKNNVPDDQPAPPRSFAEDSAPEAPVEPEVSSESGECSSVGQFLVGQNCGYLVCDDDGMGGFRKIPGVCPQGLCFNPANNYCDWPSQ